MAQRKSAKKPATRASKPRTRRSAKPSAPKAKQPPGRPTAFTQALADAICQRIAEGESLRSVCLDEAMPAKGTVLRWAHAEWPEDDPRAEFGNQYVRACAIRAEGYAEDIVDIADDGTNDFVATEKGVLLDKEAVMRSKLRIDARKWLAAKLLPKKYGEKVELQGSEERPVRIEVTTGIDRDPQG